jgi:hypothetical protein
LSNGRRSVIVPSVAGSLAGVEQKWQRARLHQEALAREIPGDTYPTTAERHRDGLEYVFRVREVPPFDPIPFALRAGDCLFNLRAALDHIVYALHVRRYRGNVPADAEKQSSFPILDKPRMAKGNPVSTDKWNAIKRLSFKQRRAIAHLQPYNRRHDQFEGIRRALDDLNRLNIIDKHRHLHVVRRAVVAVPVGWMPPEWGHRSDPSWVPLESHLEVQRWMFDVAPPEAEIAKYLQTQSYVVADVTLDEGGKRTQLAPFMQNLVRAVQAVIERFGVFLYP